MQRMLHPFAIKITPVQSTKLFTATKSPKRSCTEHCLYLVAFNKACGGAENLVLEYIVHFTKPSIKGSMLTRLNLVRTHYLRQAEELIHSAQSVKIEMHGKKIGKDVVINLLNVRKKGVKASIVVS